MVRKPSGWKGSGPRNNLGQQKRLQNLTFQRKCSWKHPLHKTPCAVEEQSCLVLAPHDGCLLSGKSQSVHIRMEVLLLIISGEREAGAEQHQSGASGTRPHPNQVGCPADALPAPPAHLWGLTLCSCGCTHCGCGWEQIGQHAAVLAHEEKPHMPLPGNPHDYRH